MLSPRWLSVASLEWEPSGATFFAAGVESAPFPSEKRTLTCFEDSSWSAPLSPRSWERCLSRNSRPKPVTAVAAATVGAKRTPTATPGIRIPIITARPPRPPLASPTEHTRMVPPYRFRVTTVRRPHREVRRRKGPLLRNLPLRLLRPAHPVRGPVTERPRGARRLRRHKRRQPLPRRLLLKHRSPRRLRNRFSHELSTASRRRVPVSLLSTAGDSLWFGVTWLIHFSGQRSDSQSGVSHDEQQTGSRTPAPASSRLVHGAPRDHRRGNHLSPARGPDRAPFSVPVLRVSHAKSRLSQNSRDDH